MLLPWLPLIIFSGLWSLTTSQAEVVPARKARNRTLLSVSDVPSRRMNEEPRRQSQSGTSP